MRKVKENRGKYLQLIVSY